MYIHAGTIADTVAEADLGTPAKPSYMLLKIPEFIDYYDDTEGVNGATIPYNSHSPQDV